MNRAEQIRRLKALAGRPAAQSRPWYRIVNLDDDGPARVDVFDEIGGSWFSDGVTATGFTAALAAVPSGRALEVHINSPGGDVFDGIAIYNAIAQRQGPVTTVVDGLAASAASFIAQAGKKRVVSPGSMMMIHDASGLCIGNAADMRELADLLDQVSGNLADIYAAHAGKTAAAWRDAMQAETWYKALDAVEAGLADQLAERPAPEGATARFDLSLFARAPGWLRAAAAPHDPFTGTHSHAHPAMGSQGGDDGHEHEHSHDGDADHGHIHPQDRTPGPAAAAPGAETPVCQTCGGRGKLKHPGTGQSTMQCPSCEGTGLYDPDEGDGDAQDRAPRLEGTGPAALDERMRAIVREEMSAAAVAAGPGGAPEDSTDKSVFSQRLREMRGAMPSLKGADA